MPKLSKKVRTSLIAIAAVLIAASFSIQSSAWVTTVAYHSWTSCGAPNNKYFNWQFGIPYAGGSNYPTHSISAFWQQSTAEYWGFGCVIHITLDIVTICLHDLNPANLFTSCGSSDLSPVWKNAIGQNILIITCCNHVIFKGDRIYWTMDDAYGCTGQICDDVEYGITPTITAT